jgi:hypothetical protein
MINFALEKNNYLTRGLALPLVKKFAQLCPLVKKFVSSLPQGQSEK